MEHHDDKFFRTSFRLRGLPHSVKTLENVANLVSKNLGDISAHHVRVFSLATELSFGDSSVSKVATLMFAAIPSLVQDYKSKEQWEIPTQGAEPGHRLVMDTHFEGMTTLNDVDHLSHSCIAISGLASHPFGSWQPRDSDKTFMWIRDALPKDIHGIRAVIYGYETKLAESQSFERIGDIANKLITFLTTYGWGLRSSKPVVFLAHSLGGLILRDALRQLANSSSEEYKTLTKILRGALFFGVPNLGIEQASFLAIVQGNPNDTLIDDIGRGSDYLRQLNGYPLRDLANEHFRCFWAYETSESPTVRKTSGGGIGRIGPPAILVSRESATLRLIESNPSVTFPIKATHSDMVKFTRESPDYHIVISKIYSIVNDDKSNDYPSDGHRSHTGHQTAQFEMGRTVSSNSVEGDVTAKFNAFRRLSGITVVEEADFLNTTCVTVETVANEIQRTQEEGGGLMYMRRLQPFLMSMKRFAEVSEIIRPPNSMAYGPMQYILRATSSYSDAFNCILDAYQDIGEQIPQVYQERLASNQHLKHVLVLIYSDILWFHGELLRQLKQREWRTLFISTWADFLTCLDQIKENIARSRRVIEGNVSYKELEEVQNIRASSLQTFRANKAAQDASRRVVVMQWLSSYSCETDQARYRKTRSICHSPGEWLLKDSRFQNWSVAEFCSDPLLWLNGIPGAGKTILASVVVDHLRLIPDAAVAYFYCKYGNESRDSFIGLARAILTQLLHQRPSLTPYLFEKASTSGDALLNSTTTARDMIQTVLSSCNKTYIVIDGIDECGRIHRDEIVEVFRTAVENLPAEVIGSVRCLFVSQDDDNARRNFRDLPAIKITNESQGDLKDFAEKRHLALEDKFGLLRSKDHHIANILTARARGMFIFADLFSKYLAAQLNRRDLLAELDPSKLPVNLDHVYVRNPHPPPPTNLYDSWFNFYESYERILVRVFEARDESTVAPVRQILGWITCARRPLKWVEVQGAVCVDLDNQVVDHDKMLLDSPKGLFASLIEVGEDDTVELVHETARDYLYKHVINFREVNYSLAIVSIGYLTLPQLDIHEQQAEGYVYVNLVNGTYSFYDYASACWAMHLQDGLSGLTMSNDLTQLLETLETFIELHWSPTHKPLQDLKRVQNSLDPIKASEYFEKIIHAVGWAKRQSSRYGQGPSQHEALDLWRVTKNIRSVLEGVQKSRSADLREEEEEERKLQKFYGLRWFKCPRVNCLHYHEGFATFEQREHHLNKHDRPFLCYISGCHMEVFGYATRNELKKHLFKYHGIDRSDETSDDEFPDPPKRKAVNIAKSEGTYECTQCNKKFTRNHNLQNHIRSHQGLKPFKCQHCGEEFARKGDCDRHEREIHGEKKFICFGSLKNGGTWGCKKAFGRSHQLASHFQSEKGKACIKPHLEEKMRENSGDGAENGTELFDDQTGENANSLRAAAKSLPPFQEFLQLCGLVPHATKLETEAPIPGNRPGIIGGEVDTSVVEATESST
ncbi:hypothetical protein NUW58_g4128 [Xylaria curta]|uniref:Uncharacterized protein n=1 Tax=Xylaria curta TaxID=42375 RepID=A0ACC1P7R6_9PEZI|nr:hypothetical protein NUW58_g4128 [Xylaria curta]